MSKGITRYGDNSSGHDACSSVPWQGGLASTVFINGKTCGIIGTFGANHGCTSHPSHSPVIINGSSTVFAIGKAIARIGDSCNCGDKVNIVSGNVFAN